ncbi:hypothetical protein L2E82_31320 [Cichorium intybus]|uniref:Uncharacterized protein n=1 Tax=Cichorium intybus TaxID=13427 RepID=A0ACB9D374_CICIN|nr:hypothetical protein L2E82_31320 [Cichorium intybus]
MIPGTLKVQLAKTLSQGFADSSWTLQTKTGRDILLDLPRITIEEQIKVMISSPRWSYHDLEHYNCVRLKEETCNEPKRPIIIKPDADFSVKSNQANVVGKTVIHLDSIKTVKIGSGCENEDKIQQVLFQVNGNVDAAIEFIIADEGTEENSDENDRITFSMDTSHGNDRKDLETRHARKAESERRQIIGRSFLSPTDVDLKEKLTKIMASDYFKITPEMKAPADVAAEAVRNYSF